MSAIRQYLLTVTAAALFCSVLIGMIGEKSAYSKIVKMLAGITIAIAVVSPLTGITFSDFSAYLDGLEAEAGYSAQAGKISVNQEISAIIKEKTKAYILDKAVALGLEIEVEVKLNDGDPPLPDSVMICGAVSPYQKKIMQEWIAKDLQIPEEKQTWS